MDEDTARGQGQSVQIPSDLISDEEEEDDTQREVPDEIEALTNRTLAPARTGDTSSGTDLDSLSQTHMFVTRGRTLAEHFATSVTLHEPTDHTTHARESDADPVRGAEVCFIF